MLVLNLLQALGKSADVIIFIKTESFPPVSDGRWMACTRSMNGQCVQVHLIRHFLNLNYDCISESAMS